VLKKISYSIWVFSRGRGGMGKKKIKQLYAVAIDIIQW